MDERDDVEIAARAIMPGDDVEYAGEVVKVFRFNNSVCIFFDSGVDWEIPPDEMVMAIPIVTVLDSDLDFFLSDGYPVHLLPDDPQEVPWL